MKILDFHSTPSNLLPASVVTVGNFDGVHLGHRAIVGKALERAHSLKVPSVVVTFDPHPREVVNQGEIVPAIATFDERARLIAELGIDHLLKVRFTPDFARVTAVDFLVELCAKVHPRVVVIGHDFRFGQGREGDEAFLERAGRKLGFAVDSVPVIEVEGQPVSSTRIRGLIQRGLIRHANQLLGAPFSIDGEVIHGHGRGHHLGFATANLRWTASLIPPDGVYAAVAFWNHQRYPAVVNIGRNPTFDDVELSIEAHILNFQGDLYTRSLRLAFHQRLREELKFNSPAELIAQIKQDVAEARQSLIAETGEDLFDKTAETGRPG